MNTTLAAIISVLSCVVFVASAFVYDAGHMTAFFVLFAASLVLALATVPALARR